MSFQLVMQRVLQMIPLLIGVSILGFGMMHLAPGGPCSPLFKPRPAIQHLSFTHI